MPRNNRTHQKNENRYQIKRDKQYKQFLGIAQTVSKSLEQFEVFETPYHYTSSNSESPQQYSGLRFDTTQKCLLGLLFLTAVGSLVPSATATAEINDTNSLVPRDSFIPSVNATSIIPLQINPQISQDRKKFSNKASQEIGLFRHKRKSVAVVGDSVEKFYCAPQITCSTKGDVNSCKYTVDNPQYWDDRLIVGGGGGVGVLVGTYNFWGAGATFHSAIIDRPQCAYGLSDSGLSLLPKIESNLEAYKNSTTQWFVYSGKEQCMGPSTPQDCPLKEAHSLAVFYRYTTEPNNYLRVAANNRSLPMQLTTGFSAAIRYEDVLTGCNTGSQCRLDFSTDFEGIVGSTIVDTDNAMKVLQVISLPSTGVNITQINSFNSVELKKSDTPPPPASSVVIGNFINSALSASANNIGVIDNPIQSGIKTPVFFKRALSACGNATKCKIDIGLWNAPNSIGSVTVNMTDNMKILEVDSVKPSEIVVNQVDSSNAVEVDYPDRAMSRR